MIFVDRAMLTIAAIDVAGVMTPASPIPNTAAGVRFNGNEFTVYETPEELPPEPASEAG